VRTCGLDVASSGQKAGQLTGIRRQDQYSAP
jgi:hypothetical protein